MQEEGEQGNHFAHEFKIELPIRPVPVKLEAKAVPVKNRLIEKIRAKTKLIEEKTGICVLTINAIKEKIEEICFTECEQGNKFATFEIDVYKININKHYKWNLDYIKDKTLELMKKDDYFEGIIINANQHYNYLIKKWVIQYKFNWK